MNDANLKKFCMWAHKELADQVEKRARYYNIVENNAEPESATSVGGRALSPEEQRHRASLLALQRAIGHDALIDRAAYTWFNRLAAIRFMELHDYLPCHLRVLSGEDGSFSPQILGNALDAQMGGLDQARVIQLLQAGDDEELFRYLLLAQCRELSHCIPAVFEPLDAAMDLLLPDKLLREGSIAEQLVTTIPEQDWQNVEVLGWLYQYYNSEQKDDFFNSKRKASAGDIAPATQLFTPEWIVRYMVENSLGRLWMLNFPESKLAEGWSYYIVPDEQHEDFIRIASPEDISLCDPACGSGHILVYAFQLLFSMYVERGYREREIPQLILQKNLAGMEIDPRAAQIASLALAMCAREHDRRFFGKGVRANICVVKPTSFERDESGTLVELPASAEVLKHPQLLDALEHLDEIGSLFCPSEQELQALRADAQRFKREAESGSLFVAELASKLQGALEVCEALAQRFTCVVANPPYMGSSRFSPFMSKWIGKNYPDVKSDLCTCFIERIISFSEVKGVVSLITSDTCMYLSSFEPMRNKLISNHTLVALIDTRGTNAHPDVFDANAGWIIQTNRIDEYEGAYFKLNQKIGEKDCALQEAIANPDCGWFYRRNAKTFTQIPGTPIAYWASEAILDAFKNGKQLSEIGRPRQGLATGENARFVREWWEVSDDKSYFDCPSIEESVQSGKKWFPYNKGGDFRKWYGNNDCIVNWENDGEDIRGFAGAVIRNPDCYFKPSATWSKISSGCIAFRYKPEGHVFDVAGTGIYAKTSELLYLQGVCNSSVVMTIASMLSPTLNFEVGQIATYPIIENEQMRPTVEKLVDRARTISKLDWDSFETSWDFKRHPLL